MIPRDPDLGRNVRWWAFYTVLQVGCHLVLSSVGAFFHFLLGHGINLVEGWLHGNGWVFAMASKGFALWATHRTLRVRFYRPLTPKQFLRDGAQWPERRVWVVAVFLLVVLLWLGRPAALPHNFPYTGAQLTAFTGVLAWFMGDVLMAATLHDLFPALGKRARRWRLAAYFGLFALSFRITVPDYFHTALVVYLHFLSALMLAGTRFRRWEGALAYLALVASPSAALLGLDPLWGADFSPFRLSRPPAAPFLLMVWVLSWAYYFHRHRWRGTGA